MKLVLASASRLYQRFGIAVRFREYLSPGSEDLRAASRTVGTDQAAECLRTNWSDENAAHQTHREAHNHREEYEPAQQMNQSIRDWHSLQGKQ